LQVTKTVRVPVHHALTEHKLHILDRLTARLTYGVWLWSKLFDERNLKGTYADRRRFYEQVKAETRLPGHMVQCCFDTAKWMWRSYRALRREWGWQVAQARRNGDSRWLRKLLKREPQKPFSKGMTGKVPIWFDSVLGSIEKAKIKLCPCVARISTLHKGARLVIPLNPARYHLELLSKGEVKSFQLVKHYGKYCAHVKVEYAVQDQPVLTVRGIDLGVKRSLASVTLRPHQPLRSRDCVIVRNGLKRDRLQQLGRRIAELQQAKKWTALKRIRHKRLRVAEHYDRLAAKLVARMSQSCLVVVGYPKGIKYQNFRGNGKPVLRRLLTGWSYARIIRYIQEECAEQGIRSEASDECFSSLRCHRCGSTHTERPAQSLFHCWNCELWYNADLNAAVNIGSRFLAAPLTRTATEGLAQAGDELAHKPASPEVENQMLTPLRQQA
jgi:putative transposase